MPSDEINRAKNLLLEMYLDLKEEKEAGKIEEKKEKLNKLSLIDLIKYISKNIPILIDIKLNKKYEEKIKKEKEAEGEGGDKDSATSLWKQYEELLIKAENDIRKHIKVRKNFK